MVNRCFRGGRGWSILWLYFSSVFSRQVQLDETPSTLQFPQILNPGAWPSRFHVCILSQPPPGLEPSREATWWVVRGARTLGPVVVIEGITGVTRVEGDLISPT